MLIKEISLHTRHTFTSITRHGFWCKSISYLFYYLPWFTSQITFLISSSIIEHPFFNDIVLTLSITCMFVCMNKYSQCDLVTFYDTWLKIIITITTMINTINKTVIYHINTEIIIHVLYIFKDKIYHFYRNNMMTSSNGNIFRVSGPLCGEFTGPRWIPHTKASDAELSCFLWSASE